MQTLGRYVSSAWVGSQMDTLTYSYNNDALGNFINQLNNFTNTIGPGPDNLVSTSYGYTPIGEVSQESNSSQTMQILWTPYGKVDTVIITGGSGAKHYYLYDGMGNQVRDILYSGSTLDTTFHIYDGHNMQIAVYHEQVATITGVDRMGITERYLYGSDKLGTLPFGRQEERRYKIKWGFIRQQIL